MRFEISRRVAAILFFAIVLGSVLSFLTHNELLRYREVRDTRLLSIQKAEWIFVQSILNENYDKAKLSTSLIKEKILTQINSTYGNNIDKLRYDLDNPSMSLPIYRILNDSIKGVFLNKNSDANDPLVFTKDGIIADLSLDCTPVVNGQSEPFRTWEQEYKMQANPQLARIAVTSMINLAKYPVFWEFSKSDNPNHKQIQIMSIYELEKVFMSEGLEGLRTYEFSSVTPIFSDKDLAARPLVTTLGVKPADTKIVYIAQGFNIVDAIEVNHKEAVHYLATLREAINQQYKSSLEQATLTYILTMILLFTCFVGVFMAGSLCINCGDIDEGDDSDEPTNRGHGS